jgi:hypothetical protein
MGTVTVGFTPHVPAGDGIVIGSILVDAAVVLVDVAAFGLVELPQAVVATAIVAASTSAEIRLRRMTWYPLL